MDSVYLKQTVAGAIARGTAEAAIVAPVDPVEYLAKWLLNYVENEKVTAQLERDAAARTTKLEAHKAAAKKELDAAKSRAESKAKSLEHLRTISDDPFELMQAACDAIKNYTDCAHCYIALLEEDIPPEPEEEEPEAEPAEAPPEPEAVEEEGEQTGDEGGLEGFTYDDKNFNYVAANKENEWMIGKRLHRGEGVSYDIVTSKSKYIDIPNVLYRPEEVKFFSGFPRVGAYFASAITLNTLERVGMVCADTLKTAAGGSGKPLTDDDQEFIIAVSVAVGKALDAGEELRTIAQAETGDVDELQAANESSIEVEMAAALAQGEAEKLLNAEGLEGFDLSGGTGGRPGGLIGFDGSVLGPDGVPKLDKDLTPEEQELKQENLKLQAVNKLLLDLKSNALAELKSYPRPPKNTFKVLKAILYILGHKKNECDEWNKCRQLIDQALINRMRDYDAQQPRNANAWKGVRIATKGLLEEEVAKESKAGSILFKWVKCVQSVSDTSVNARKVAAEAAAAAAEA
ncbi:hypothetical protein CYMTET_38414 [Cymbomonas tetramitiformis]|uniref:Uncharacterized protein n=1 Tax=Cymbomonas tetramitiformis TaxID=36881 RepID=A0AAE0CDL7_9CHLO|nr:hypothetical protein CYMTET_38414 [Cymbomonas tetramitiformis]